MAFSMSMWGLLEQKGMSYLKRAKKLHKTDGIGDLEGRVLVTHSAPEIVLETE